MDVNFSGFSKGLNKRLKNNLTEWQKDAFSIHELACNLETIADDDNKEIINYTLEEIINEAIDCLDMFECSGTIQYDEYKGKHGEEAKEHAKLQVKQLKNFIRKYIK